MNTPLNPLDENKKHAAFKRFSKMSAAGLAVLSLSAFTDVAAKQLPANVEKCVVNNQNLTLLDLTSDNLFDIDEVPWSTDYGGNYTNSSYGNYCNYYNYSNYSNYSNNNNYSNTYSNTYSNNYSDIS